MKGDLSTTQPDHPEASSQQASGPPNAASRVRTGRRSETSRRVYHTLFIFLGLFILSPVLLSLTGSLETVAQALLARFSEAPQPVLINAEEIKPPPPPRPVTRDLKFADSEDHPDRLFQPYFGASPSLLSSTVPTSRLVMPFRDLLDLFMKRQGEDDNFTIRVFDNRDGAPLELYTLIPERDRYEQSGQADWVKIDALRRTQTQRLAGKYEKLGYPRDAISARWGRKNQVLEARVREAPLIEYEMRLTRYLGLSLLATEIGTVETFNQDWMVSSVGARSRYQMMPYILRQSNIHRYKLQTSSGKKVEIHEEWHPLLTMEPAFLLLRGYVNAVGHEIPGISAYHTGPGNIFKIYTKFLNEASDLSTPNTTVLDAYAWAVTEGFDSVSKETSFRSNSQGYVAAGYGSLRAVEELPIDTTLTLRAERVQLKADRSIDLSDLLTALTASGVSLRWARGTASLSLYERFRHLNPHFDLPAAAADGGVPSEGNVRLVDRVDHATVRFFLPLNASEVLAHEGIDVLDEAATFRFDQNTYRLQDDQARTEWDRQYTQLVREISRFGFTQAHRRQLDMLVDKFEELAAADSSHYRMTQLATIKAHRGLWSFKGWNTVAEAAENALGRIHLQNLSPLPPDTTLPPIERMVPLPPTSGAE